METFSNKEKFNLAYNNLLLLNKNFTDFVFKSTGATLIILGWLVSQKNPVPGLENAELFWVGIVAISISLMIVVWHAMSLCRYSLKTKSLLSEINLTSYTYYESLIITRLQTWMFIISTLVLYKAVYVIIFEKYYN